MPIAGASVTYSLYEGTNHHGLRFIISDSDGKFKLIHTSKEYISGLEIKKSGYLIRFSLNGPGVEIINQIENITDIEVKMHPWDALLRIIYNNTLPQEKAVYLQAQCKTLLEAYGSLPFVITQPYPYLVESNSLDTVDYPFLSDEEIYLYWGFSHFSSVAQSLYKDSLYLARGDTATYSISF